MDASSPHSFVVDLDEDVKIKPLPFSLGNAKGKKEKIVQPEFYPKFEIEFYEVVKSCAEYIDKVSSVNERIKYTKRLNKIFVLRDKLLAMRLFRELATKEQ